MERVDTYYECMTPFMCLLFLRETGYRMFWLYREFDFLSMLVSMKAKFQTENVSQQLANCLKFVQHICTRNRLHNFKLRQKFVKCGARYSVLV